MFLIIFIGISIALIFVAMIPDSLCAETTASLISVFAFKATLIVVSRSRSSVTVASS